MKARTLIIVGGGPMGLEMAVQAVKAGLEVTVLEKGASVAANVREWGHVELFSPYSLNMSAPGIEVLQEVGVLLPDAGAFPSGAAYAREYLDVLAGWLGGSELCQIVLGAEVIAMGRGAMLKHEIGAKRRQGVGFRVMWRDAGGKEHVEESQFVVDASGTYNQPAWCGMGGMPAVGEKALTEAGRIVKKLPDVAARAGSFANRTTAVVGAGMSAITTISALKRLAGEGKGEVDVVWVVRGGKEPFKRVPDDPLPQRDALNVLGNELSLGKGLGDGFKLRFLERCCVTSAEEGGGGRVVLGLLRRGEGEDEGGEALSVECDTVVSCCGFRPDDSLWSNLQVHQCWASSAPMKLAAALLSASGGGGDCLAQASHGPDTMLNPEPGMFVVGMKSYGTGSAFLLKVGHQQVADVMDLIKQSMGGG